MRFTFEIARRAAMTRGLELPARELDAVAERAHHDPRAIEGIVTCMAFARFWSAAAQPPLS